MAKKKAAAVRSVKDGLKRGRRKRPQRPVNTEKKDFLSTGSVLVDLAITGELPGGIAKGFYYLLIGDTNSGKTFLTMNVIAEAAHNPNFDKYELVYDGSEFGALMDLSRLFGAKTASRIKAPKYEAGIPTVSTTTEEMFFNVDDHLDSGVPCIYIVDSIDSLDTAYSDKKFMERKKAVRKGTQVAGDYGDGKAALNSRYIRRIIPKLQKTGSILIIINQTRDNVGGDIYQPKKKSSGGWALQFYATVQIWTQKSRALGKTIRGQKVQQGVVSRVSIKRSRFTGKERTVEIPIYPSYGIDDIGSCIDYLVEWKHWKKTDSGVIDATEELGVKGRKDAVAKHVEEKELQNDLRQLVAEVWNEVEQASALDRKPRYS